MSSRAGRWKRVREDEAAGEHRIRGATGMRTPSRKESMLIRENERERKREEKKVRACTEVSHPCPATRANYPTSHFLPGCVPCFFDLG